MTSQRESRGAAGWQRGLLRRRAAKDCGLTEQGSIVLKLGHQGSSGGLLPNRPFRFFEIWVSHGPALPLEARLMRDSFAVTRGRKEVKPDERRNSRNPIGC